MKSESIPNVPKFRMSPLLARRGPIGMWRGSCTARHRPPRSPIRSSGNSSCNMISPKNLVLFCARMVSLLWESCGPRRAAHGGYAAVVAVGQFLQRSALRAASGGLFLLRRCESKVLRASRSMRVTVTTSSRHLPPGGASSRHARGHAPHP